MFLQVVALLTLMLAVSCKPTVPDEYIQPDEMEDILYDYHLSQSMGGQWSRTHGGMEMGQNSTSYKRNMYYHSVLKKHGVTEAEFDSSLVYYYGHADDLYKIYQRVADRMEKTAVSLGASVSDINKYSQFNADGDTANIWRDVTATVLTPYPPYNRLEFKVERDSTFKKGDSFLFNFMADFMYQGGTKDAVIYIAVRYDNDSISTHTGSVSVSGLSQLRVPGNPRNDIKEISGFVYLSRGSDMSSTLKLMFINRIQLIRFHMKEMPQEVMTPPAEASMSDSAGLKAKENLDRLEAKPQESAFVHGTAGRPIADNENIRRKMPKIRLNEKDIKKNSGK